MASTQASNEPARPELQESTHTLPQAPQGFHINIYCHTVIIGAPATGDSNPVDQIPPEPPKGVWDRTSGIPGFIKTLYWNVLDRDAESQAVIDHWTQQTYTHGLAHTVCGFFTALRSTAYGQGMSIEAMVDKLYFAVLGRQPEVAGRLHWAAQLRDGMSLLEAANGFVGSDEYRGKVQAGTRPDSIHSPSI